MPKNKHKNLTSEEKLYFYGLFTFLPILFVLIVYLLCTFRIFCIGDLLKFKLNKPSVNTIEQEYNKLDFEPIKLELNGDTLKVKGASSQVDLSMFHEQYNAGNGLVLSDDNKFSLQSFDGLAGTYGSSSMVPVITVDQYGRISSVEVAPINSGGSSPISINNMYGTSFTIQGTENQISVNSAGNTITLTLPQDINIDSQPTFKNLYLTQNLHIQGDIYDSNDNSGQANEVLLSMGNGTLQWTNVNTLTEDDQTLNWDDTTKVLGIENGNTVNLGSLAVDNQNLNWDSSSNLLSIDNGNSVDLSDLANVWSQNSIGGYYSTDKLTPASKNVQKIIVDKDGWGLTELSLINRDDSSNYSGAVLSLKGSGPDFTNNMFFGKLGDNYYVPSWAGAGVVSSDQKLVIASVESNDPAHPNSNPEILFQVGGHYNSPVDAMVLNDSGNLGIGNMTPDEKLTVSGNIHLTGNTFYRIAASGGNLDIRTEATAFDGDISIHPGNIGGNAGVPKNVFIYPGYQDMGVSKRYGNIILGAVEKEGRIGSTIAGSIDPLYDSDFIMQVSNKDDVGSSFVVSRISANPDSGPFTDYVRINEKYQPVDKDFIVGGFYGNSWTSAVWQKTVGVLGRVEKFIDKSIVTGYLQFITRNEKGEFAERMRITSNGDVGIGTSNPQARLTIKPQNGDAVLIERANVKETGILEFQVADSDRYVGLRAPLSVKDTYTMTWPDHQGDKSNVLVNNGSGDLYWSTINDLLLGSTTPGYLLYTNSSHQVLSADNGIYFDEVNDRIGIGTTSPSVKLQVVGQARVSSLSVSSGTAGTPGIRITNDTNTGIYSPGADSIAITTGGVQRLVILNDGNTGIGVSAPTVMFQVGSVGDGTSALANAWNTFSDKRFKKNITKVSDALDKVLKMEGVYYDWKNKKDSHRQIGFIAQDVQKILPEVVSQGKDGYYSIDYSKVTVVLVEAIKDLYERFEKFQDQSEQIELLEKQNKELKNKVDELESRLSRLEKLVEKQQDSNSVTNTPTPTVDSPTKKAQPTATPEVTKNVTPTETGEVGNE